VVASLTSVVFETIRHQALSNDGIPVGILGAGLRFSQLSYFWSPSFIFGCIGIRSRRFKVLTIASLLLCGILTVFSGPASALLAIPTVRSRWPAGGTDFWLIGTNETLWPNRITISHAGGDDCLDPTAENLTEATLQTSGCVWHGYTELAEGLKSRHFDWQSNITTNDGLVKRQFTRHQLTASGTETWVLGIHVATSRISRLLADEWGVATLNASSAQRHGRHANLKNATDGAGIASVASWLPVTRTSCIRYNDWGNYSGTINPNVKLSKMLKDVLEKLTVLVPCPPRVRRL
jgi:hypothetical protein